MAHKVTDISWNTMQKKKKYIARSVQWSDTWFLHGWILMPRKPSLTPQSASEAMNACSGFKRLFYFYFNNKQKAKRRDRFTQVPELWRNWILSEKRKSTPEDELWRISFSQKTKERCWELMDLSSRRLHPCSSVTMWEWNDLLKEQLNILCRVSKCWEAPNVCKSHLMSFQSALSVHDMDFLYTTRVKTLEGGSCRRHTQATQKNLPAHIQRGWKEKKKHPTLSFKLFNTQQSSSFLCL